MTIFVGHNRYHRGTSLPSGLLTRSATARTLSSNYKETFRVFFCLFGPYLYGAQGLLLIWCSGEVRDQGSGFPYAKHGSFEFSPSYVLITPSWSWLKS